MFVLLLLTGVACSTSEKNQEGSSSSFDVSASTNGELEIETPPALDSPEDLSAYGVYLLKQNFPDITEKEANCIVDEYANSLGVSREELYGSVKETGSWGDESVDLKKTEEIFTSCNVPIIPQG